MDYISFIPALLATVLYLNTLPAHFAYDDSRAIEKNPDLLSTTPLWNLFYNDFWGTPLTHSGSHKSYRPLCVLTFRLNYQLGELDPWGYHLGNVICHSITTFVFTRLAKILLASNLATLAAGLLFAAHPIHTEAVAGVVGRADILACLFVILTLRCYMRYSEARVFNRLGSRWLLSVLVFSLAAAAMLNKEHALTVLAVCATYDILIVHRATPNDILKLKIFTEPKFRYAREGLVLLTIYGALLLSLRIYLMGNKPPDFAPSDNPASDSDSFLTRALTYNYLPSVNFWMLLCPRVLSFDWSMEAIPLLESFGDVRNLCTLVFYSAFMFMLLKISIIIEKSGSKDETSGKFISSPSQRKYIYSSMQGTNDMSNSNGFSKFSKNHLSGNPCLSLSPREATATNGKHSYLAGYDNNYELSQFVSVRSVDVLILSVAMVVFPFIPASNMFFYVGFVLAERILYIPSMGVCLMVALGLDTLYSRSNSRTFRGILISAFTFLILTFSCKTVLRNLDWQTEEKLYTAGVAVNPAKAWGNLANIYNDQHQVEKAEQAYKEALSFRPNMADVYYNLGVLLQNQNRISEAKDSYKKAIHFRPKLSVAHLNLGILTAQMGDKESAKKIYSHCADLDTSGLKDPRLHDGTKISCLFNYGRLLMDEDKSQEALEIFNLALQRRPDHYMPQSLYNMIGEVYFKMDQLTEAEKWYREALAVKPDHLPAYLTMVKLMQKKELYDEAESWLERARQHHPTDRTVDFHRAQLYVSMNQHTEAIKVFDRILPDMSHDFDVVYSAAGAYREAQMKQKAEDLYLAAAKLRPNDPTAWMNLGAMLHINGKHDQAEKAYLRGLELRPNDKITLENLQRLRKLMKKTG